MSDEIKNETKNEIVKSEKRELTPMEQEISVKLRECGIFARSGILPKSFDTAEKVYTAMKYAKEIGLVGELAALRNIYVVNGMPSVWGDLPLALCLKSGLLETISESFDEKTGNAKCIVKRKNFDPIERNFSIDDSKKANIFKNVWNTFPKRMAQMRARSHSLKDAFPDVLLGISISEYDSNTIPSEKVCEKEIENSKVSAQDLTNKILNVEKPESLIENEFDGEIL